MNLKSFIRKKSPRNLYNFLSILKKDRNIRPFSLLSYLFPVDQYSDFFIYSNLCEEIFFLAENPFALIDCKPYDVIHSFNFYNCDGKHIHNAQFKSNKYNSEIKLPNLSLTDLYCSFTHEVIPDSFSKQNIKLSYQHRGYTIYKNRKNCLGSLLHGNFGAIEDNSLYKTAAKKSSKLFEYTPVYQFKDQNFYHIVFNNPTKKSIKIEVRQNNKLNEKNNKKVVPSFGCLFFEIENYTGSLTFISQLPICRGNVFKNPFKINNFDVFHS